MHWRHLFAVAALAVPACFQTVQAALSTYGYVTGTFVPGSNYLEPLDVQGKFLHYHFKVETAPGVHYEAVIDVKNGHLYPFPQRVVSIPSAASFNGVFSSANGYHRITMTSSGGTESQGAIDYIRHQGLLYAIDQPWSYIQATPTVDPNIYKMPQWDQLFVGVTRIYAFGQPYSKGRGVHVVHQNQGDKKSAFYRSNGKFQDGAVIFEYANGERKMLMTRFDDQPDDPGQADFSWDHDPDGTGPLRVGVARTPTVVQYTCQHPNQHVAAATPDRQCAFGPFPATQIEAETTVQSNYVPQVSLYEGPQGNPTALAARMKNDDKPPFRVARPHETSVIAGALHAKSYARGYKSAVDYTPNFYVVVNTNPDLKPITVTIRYVQ